MGTDDIILGIKFFTSVDKRYEDFISAGFDLATKLENLVNIDIFDRFYGTMN